MNRRKSRAEDRVLEVISSGRATTRADIARILDLAPSTVSTAVTRLLTLGYVREAGEAESTGGRPGNILLPSRNDTRILVAEFGARHIRIGLADPSGTVEDIQRQEIDISEGPAATIEKLLTLGHALADQTHTEITGIGIALPGPVDSATGTVIGPSRMPGWNGCHVPEIAARFTDLPLIVENDAQIGARGEYAFRRHQGADEFHDFIYVKAGSAIGAAFVYNGAVYRGARGIAGDITHVRVEAGGNRPCQCGNTGCLDTVASAEAVRREVSALGTSLDTNDELIAAAFDGVPCVVTEIRSAGVVLGEAIARNVSFLAPEAVILGGTLSAVDAFIAGVSQSLHERCLHSITENIVIERSRSRMDAALWGLADMASLSTTHLSTLRSYQSKVES